MISSRSLFVLLLLVAFQARSAEPLVVTSSLRSVTVYRTGAEMTHQCSIPLALGSQDVIIEGISNTIDINSIQVNCPAAVTIMGVEFTNNFLVVPEVSARIRFLQDSADRIQSDLDRIGVQIQTTSDVIEVLKANRDIKGQQTGLSVAELMKLVDYYKAKSTELQNELAALREKQKKLNLALGKLRNQIREEEKKNTRNAGQLRLQLSVAVQGKYDFSVSYLTPNAWWSPYYDIRVDNIKSPLKVIYKAKVSQTTGIDWKKVKLALSTSVPNQWGNAPLLKAWFLSYINPVTLMDRELSRNQAFNTIPSMQGKLPGVAADSGAYFDLKKEKNITGATPLYVVNGVPMSAEDFAKINPASIKSIETLKDAAATNLYGSRAATGVVLVVLKDGLEDYVSVTDNELNMTFDIDLPYDIPTTGKEQTATLREYSVGAVYKYYSVPKLDRDAYLLAEVADWEKLNLLPGQANIIFEGTYVGKSFIDPASTSDTLNLTLGKDKRVVVTREKLMDYSSVKFMGAFKHQKFTYELTVKNNKKDTVKMILKDQFPLSSNKEIEVELLDNGGAMTNAETGVLTWKLELAPGETRKVRIAYNVKYPKDKTLNLY